MNLDRRSVLKNLLIIAGGVIVVPSCLHKDESKTSIQLKHLDLSGRDEQMLSELTETIIPQTDTPGAKDTYTHLYILKMVDDCRTKEEQKAFQSGMKAFDQFVQKTTQKPLVQLTPTQRTSIVAQIERGIGVPKDAVAFYKTVKGLTIQGYMSSKFYLSKVQVYELTPGRFKGCVRFQSLNGDKENKQSV